MAAMGRLVNDKSPLNRRAGLPFADDGGGDLVVIVLRGWMAAMRLAI